MDKYINYETAQHNKMPILEKIAKQVRCLSIYPELSNPEINLIAAKLIN